MPAKRHHPGVLEFLPTPPAPAAELRDALDTILAAAANLRLYRERLTPEDFNATVRDIEDATEQISAQLAVEDRPALATTMNAKRRSR